METWVRASLRIYEFTAILVITILPALATVYAIIVSYLGRIIKRADEDFQRLRKENENRIAARRKELGKRDAHLKTTKEALQEVEAWEEELNELIESEENWKKQVAGWSFGSIFVKPAIWILTGLLGIFVAYVLLYVLPHSLGIWQLIISLILFLCGGFLVSWGLCKHVIPCLKQIDEEVRKPEEGPIEAMQRMLREQEEQRIKEQQEIFEGFIAKLDEVVVGLERLYSPKEAEYEVHFLVDNQPTDTLTIKKGKEVWATLRVDNDSRFAIQEMRVVLALPPDFSLKKDTQSSPTYRPLHLVTYPGGAKLKFDIGTLQSVNTITRPFLVKGDTVGEFKLRVWINSTTHEKFQIILSVVVTE